MKYKYRLVILFKSGNLWEVGVPTKRLAYNFARLLVRDTSDVEIMSLVTEKTGYIAYINPRKLMN